MNLTLVLTVLSTCGGLVFVGAESGWLGNGPGCEAPEAAIAIEVGGARPRPAAATGSGEIDDSGAGGC